MSSPRKLTPDQRKRLFTRWFLKHPTIQDMSEICEVLEIDERTARAYREELQQNWHEELIKAPSTQQRTERWYGRAIEELHFLIEQAYEDLDSLPKFDVDTTGVSLDAEGKRISLFRTLMELYHMRNEIVGLTGRTMAEEEIKEQIAKIKEKVLKALEKKKDRGEITPEEYERRKKIVLTETESGSNEVV